MQPPQDGPWKRRAEALLKQAMKRPEAQGRDDDPLHPLRAKRTIEMQRRLTVP